MIVQDEILDIPDLGAARRREVGANRKLVFSSLRFSDRLEFSFLNRVASSRGRGYNPHACFTYGRSHPYVSAGRRVARWEIL